MRALSIRQPYAELILRGLKTVEHRSRPTKIIGRRFYIYAARQWAAITVRCPLWSRIPQSDAATICFDGGQAPDDCPHEEGAEANDR